MKCPHCGFNHAEHVEVCPITGHVIQPVQPSQPQPASVQKKPKPTLPARKQTLIGTLCVAVGGLGLISSLVMIGLGLVGTGDHSEQTAVNGSKHDTAPQTANSNAGASTKQVTQPDEPSTDSAIKPHTQPAEGDPSLLQPTHDVTPTSRTTLTPTQSAVPLPIDSRINPADGMTLVLVPEGPFIMGSDPETDPYFWGAEGPSHEVTLDAYWIYQTEVTNAMYQECVAAQACPKPLRNESRTNEDYYLSPKFYDYPVIQVNWIDAVAYCQWAGGRLPTEAEWEKAARGTDGRLFPWGDSPVGPNLASFCGTSCPNGYREPFDDGYPELAPVGLFPAGASPYGALDMAGNVWEWVFDVFSQGYYSTSPDENPRGPLSGDKHVIRGGSWEKTAEGLRTVMRTSLQKNDGLDTVGFRCAQDAAP